MTHKLRMRGPNPSCWIGIAFVGSSQDSKSTFMGIILLLNTSKNFVHLKLLLWDFESMFHYHIVDILSSFHHFHPFFPYFSILFPCFGSNQTASGAEVVGAGTAKGRAAAGVAAPGTGAMTAEPADGSRRARAPREAKAGPSAQRGPAGQRRHFFHRWNIDNY